MLNVVQLHDLSNFPFKVGTIIQDDLLWYSKLVNNVVLYESGHMLGFQYRVGGCLYPLGEVVNHRYDGLMPFEALRTILSIIFMPQIEKRHGEVILYSSLGGTWFKFACVW